MEQLINILSYRREYKSEGEWQMINNHILPLKPKQYIGADGVIAAYVVIVPNTIPKADNILWSCHTDTMHHGRPTLINQEVWCDDQGTVFVDTTDDCLGADDGAGLWLMLEMIEAKVPGTYIFHRGEEKGGIGSKIMREEYADFISEHTHAIAFDRRGTTSIITHQGGQRGASDLLANYLIELLDMDHEIDTGGSYTDTKEYFSLVPECLNFSIGYENEHSSSEILDTVYLQALRDKLCSIDWAQVSLPVARDKTLEEYDDDWGYGNRWGSYTAANTYDGAGLFSQGVPTIDELRDYTYAELKSWVTSAPYSDVAWVVDDLMAHIQELEYTLGIEV